ncbi:MAG: 30S ribosomal protein S5 [Chloroflexi bacterium]|nr:30S ribosomal protein S5 [Chloroflexota bacterium]
MVNLPTQTVDEEFELQAATAEKVVDISRVAKVVKGGRHLSFRALVVVGDGNGRVGAGVGKSDAIPDAVRKGTTYAQKSLVTFPLKGSSVPHQVEGRFGAAYVMIKPAPQGTGIIAGTSMRAVLELAGIKDVVAKSFRSQNPINVVRATLEALRDLKPLSSPVVSQRGALSPAPVSAIITTEETPEVTSAPAEAQEGATSAE